MILRSLHFKFKIARWTFGFTLCRVEIVWDVDRASFLTVITLCRASCLRQLLQFLDSTMSDTSLYRVSTKLQISVTHFFTESNLSHTGSSAWELGFHGTAGAQRPRRSLDIRWLRDAAICDCEDPLPFLRVVELTAVPRVSSWTNFFELTWKRAVICSNCFKLRAS